MSEATRAPGRVGSLIKGKWRVDARIGSGGMATVYGATHRNGHRAAIKMLHTQLSRDPSVRARFLREAYVANAIAHPGVVRVEDDDTTEDGAVFLVLELLEGETIEARRVRMGGVLALDEVLEYADQALDALSAAHEKGIVHRDVKPDNVFVTTTGQVKLLDFGLARMKTAQAEATKTGVTIGTPEFMPPEQAMGRRDAVDARSDVWGLGATLFTALSGMYVHDAPTLHEQLVASATQRARSIRSVAPTVPAAIASVIDRALELEMDDRWASAIEMKRAFRAARGSTSEPSYASESVTYPVSSKTQEIPATDRTVSIPSAPPTSGKTLTDGPDILRGQISERTVAMTGGLTRPLSRGELLDPISVAPPTPPPTTARLSSTHSNSPAVVHQAAPPAPPPYNMPPGATPSGGVPHLGAYPSMAPMSPMQSMHGSGPPPPSSVRPAPPPKNSTGLAVFLAVLFFVLAALMASYLYFRGHGFTGAH